ncbi:MAG TPA: cysteine desulfurase [Candidatus Saccharimonadales bacterium]|nr:cysteine desulfurase [Candidatus Saccharimonadales bacterium]
MSATLEAPGRMEQLRAEFPLLSRTVHGRPLVYLDSAATSQKPRAVLRAMQDFYERHNSNIHRGVYLLSEEATAMHEAARARVAEFLGVQARELVFTRNATEAINLVAYAWARTHLRAGDAIVLTEMEHHANLVPWHILREERGIEIRYLPVTPEGRLELPGLDRLLDGARLLGVTHVSNVLGTVNPVRELADRAHAAGALVLVDGAQSAPHLPLRVPELGCDFFAFTGHKMLGPTGIGGLWARRELLEAMPPFLGGGDMIREVRLSGSKWNDVPFKFEAGTPAIAEAVGLGAAVEFMEGIGREEMRAHEASLVDLAMRRLAEVPQLRILGPPAGERAAVVAFTLGALHPHDVAAVLDHEGVAVRAGHHCAMPVHEKLGVPASARASFHVYNQASEIDALVRGLHRALTLFKV